MVNFSCLQANYDQGDLISTGSRFCPRQSCERKPLRGSIQSRFPFCAVTDSRKCSSGGRTGLSALIGPIVSLCEGD